jgi:hypothetical protein
MVESPWRTCTTTDRGTGTARKADIGRVHVIWPAIITIRLDDDPAVVLKLVAPGPVRGMYG